MPNVNASSRNGSGFSDRSMYAIGNTPIASDCGSNPINYATTSVAPLSSNSYVCLGSVERQQGREATPEEAISVMNRSQQTAKEWRSLEAETFPAIFENASMLDQSRLQAHIRAQPTKQSLVGRDAYWGCLAGAPKQNSKTPDDIFPLDSLSPSNGAPCHSTRTSHYTDLLKTAVIDWEEFDRLNPGIPRPTLNPLAYHPVFGLCQTLRMNMNNSSSSTIMGSNLVLLPPMTPYEMFAQISKQSKSTEDINFD